MRTRRRGAPSAAILDVGSRCTESFICLAEAQTTEVGLLRKARLYMPYSRYMKRVKVVAPLLLAALPTATFSRGVSPYLPLNLAPEIESQIERVLILADKPVMTRPIAAATVLDALPKACRVDQELCQRVRRYLQRYIHTEGIARASIEGAAPGGSGGRPVAPNRYGMRENSNWNASAQVYAQLGSYVLLNAGAVAYEGKTDFTGSMLSLGFDYAQVDLGYRPHWFSPMTDSSMLLSTEAPTMPSVTISNYQPISPFTLHYEIFGATMSRSDRVVLGEGFSCGFLRLSGFLL